MPFLVAAGVLVALAGVQWLASGPRSGDLGRDLLAVVFGRRATKRTGLFSTDDRGVYVVQRAWSYVLLAAAGTCAWIGILTVLIG